MSEKHVFSVFGVTNEGNPVLIDSIIAEDVHVNPEGRLIFFDSLVPNGGLAVSQFAMGKWSHYKRTTYDSREKQDEKKRPFVLKTVPTLRIARSANNQDLLLDYDDGHELTDGEIRKLLVDYLNMMEYGIIDE